MAIDGAHHAGAMIAESMMPTIGGKGGRKDGTAKGGDAADNAGDVFDPVAFAQGEQGTPPYTGIDDYTAGTL